MRERKPRSASDGFLPMPAELARPVLYHAWLMIDCSATCGQPAGESSEGAAHVARVSSTGAIPAVMLVLAIAGCGAPGTTSGRAVPGHPQAAPVKTRAAVPVTGTRLSALMAAPAGFTADPSKSDDSGEQVLTTPTRPGPSPQDISCASWWAGTSYVGPGDVGYAIKKFTRSDGTTLTVIVNLYRRGGGTSVFDATMALHNRCTHFTYQDADGLRYLVDIKPASPAGLGDRSMTYGATETADGDVFPTEVTFIQLGDATIGINQTGPAASPPVRIVPPLARLITALRAAGY